MTKHIAIKPPSVCMVSPHKDEIAYRSLIEKYTDLFSTIEHGIITVPARRIMLRRGDRPNRVYVLFSGWGFRFILLPDGRRQILSLLIPGDLVPFQAFTKKPINFSVQAITDTSWYVSDSTKLMETFKSSSGLEFLFESLIDLFERADSHIFNIGRHSATERLAQLILVVEQRLRTRGQVIDGAFEFPLRQEHLADILGLTPVHVSRTLSNIRESGVIHLERATMMIKDRDGLLQMAGGAGAVT